MTDPDRLEISLFGTLTLRRGSEDLPLISSSDAKNLLVFLALNRGRPHPRSVVVGQFWEDLAESRARRALSQALWHLRKALPEALDLAPREIARAPAGQECISRWSP
ncbi:MAG: hypothetical protein KC609_09790 [Myxococcales bacterium]|nr:hypothetical protein [Myxococcales bacterium]